MKKYIFFFLVLLCAAPIMAQNYDTYLYTAQHKFDQGDYENAQKALNIYVEMTGQNKADLSAKISTVLVLLKTAQNSVDNQNYAHAITAYKKVLSINPKDPNIQNNINKLQSIIDNVNNVNHANTVKNKSLQIGDKVNGYTICYLDETQMHGWVIRISNNNGTWFNHQFSNSEWRMPSLDECKIIYKNKFKLGLNKAYWTSTRSKKVANWKFYYTFDFGTGKEKSTDSYKIYPGIYIKNF